MLLGCRKGSNNCDKNLQKLTTVKEESGKVLLSEFLTFLKYKVDNDLLTVAEADALMRIIEGGFDLIGTVDDLAAYYGQSRSNVSMVINRRMIQKPLRRVFYSFKAFSKIVPKSWRRNRQDSV